MTVDGWWFCGMGAVLAVINVATTRRLWASPMFERPQKIAQTVLLWLVPGSFLVVRHVLGEMRPRRERTGTADSTVGFGTGEVGIEALPEHHHEAHGGWDGGGGHHGGGHGGGDFGGGH